MGPYSWPSDRPRAVQQLFPQIWFSTTCLLLPAFKWCKSVQHASHVIHEYQMYIFTQFHWFHDLTTPRIKTVNASNMVKLHLIMLCEWRLQLWTYYECWTPSSSNSSCVSWQLWTYCSQNPWKSIRTCHDDTKSNTQANETHHDSTKRASRFRWVPFVPWVLLFCWVPLDSVVPLGSVRPLDSVVLLGSVAFR